MPLSSSSADSLQGSTREATEEQHGKQCQAAAPVLGSSAGNRAWHARCAHSPCCTRRARHACPIDVYHFNSQPPPPSCATQGAATHLLTMAFSLTISRAPTASTAPVTTGRPMGITLTRITKEICSRPGGQEVGQGGIGTWRGQASHAQQTRGCVCQLAVQPAHWRAGGAGGQAGRMPSQASIADCMQALGKAWLKRRLTTKA